MLFVHFSIPSVVNAVLPSHAGAEVVNTFPLRKLWEIKIMTQFIELPIAEEDEAKMAIINIASIGRIYPNPQVNNRSIVELNYQSINDAPVYLEVDLPYEKLRLNFLS